MCLWGCLCSYSVGEELECLVSEGMTMELGGDLLPWISLTKRIFKLEFT